MVTKVPMTVSGIEKLRDELQRLKQVDRPKIINAIAEARAHGDLKENAEYHAAREQQSFIEGRIMEIESKLAGAHVIDVTLLENMGRVVFGATVTLIHGKTRQTVMYQIVGEDESDIACNKISIISPLARALVGKYEGDKVAITTADGMIEYEITEVAYI